MEDDGRANRREQYELLLDVLKDTRAGVVDYSFKHGAILTLFLGWIVSSQETQRFLDASVGRKTASSALILAYGAMYAVWTATWRHRSEVAYKHLVKLDYMPRDYYEDLRVPAFLVVSFVTLQSLGCLTALYFLITL
jgi:hypothetical protein